ADADAGRTQVGRHAHLGDADESDAGILQLTLDDLHDLLPDLRPDLSGAVAGHERRARLLDLLAFEAEGVHRLAALEVLEALQADTALLARDHLAHVLLEVLEGGDAALPDLGAVAVQLGVPAAGHLALHDPRAGDDAQPRDLDRHHHVDPTFLDLPVGGLAQALGRALHVLGEL